MSAPSAAAATSPAGRLPSVSIVIPVHNKAALTRQCLNMLLAESTPGIDRVIVVVDDGSIDQTPEVLAAYGDNVRSVRHERATGFAGACNAGAATAAGDTILFLNNDTLPQPGWLEAMAGHLAAHPAAAAVGAKLLFPNRTIQHAGVVFGLNRYPNHIYAGFPADHPGTQTSRPFQAVTAACMLIRRDAWTAMGGFDRAFVNGWEDVDLCLRLGEAGYEIRYCAEAVVYHLESATRDLRAPQERANRAEYERRWLHKVRPDDFSYFHADGLVEVVYPARYPIQVTFSPLLAGVKVGANERLSDLLLHERARQTSILLRNNIVLNLRVQEAEQRAMAADDRAKAAEEHAAALAARAEHAANQADPAVPGAGPGPGPDGLHPILGRVESPSRAPGLITDTLLPIAGWAMSRAGIRSVETYVDGQRLGEVIYGESRPDAVALFPEFAGQEECGFVGTIPVGELADGPHELEIRIIANDGKTAPIATSFEIDAAAFATGRVLMKLDRPSAGTRLTRRDRLFVSGWALSPNGIDRVEILVDGEPAGNLAYGALRPDVARLYPFYPSVDHCGFAGSMRAADLAAGDHVLTVRPVGQDGKTGEQTVAFAVEATEALGEVPHLTARYPEWLARNEPDAAALAALRERIAVLPVPPTFDLVLPVVAGPIDRIAATIESVRAQVFSVWRLFVPVTGGASDEVRQWAQSLVGVDARIGIAVDEQPRAFADLANAALDACSADWVAVLAAGDRLAPQALAEVALNLLTHPETDILYADEDRLDPDSGQRWDPFFKPDWSPELHLARPYFGPATFYRRPVLARVGGLRASLAGAEAYDLALRATEATSRIRHLPRMLVSREASLAEAGTVDSAARVAEARALTEAVARRGLAGTVEPGNHPRTWRIRHAIAGAPEVTIVMPTGGKMQFLRPCLDDLLHRTSWPHLHILILDNSSGDEVAALVEDLSRSHPNLTRVPVALTPFNFSALINASIPHLDTPFALLLNDDVTIVTPDWVEAMLEHAQRPEIGVVGAKLLYPDGAIQHAGVLLGPYRGTGHAFKFFPGDDPGYFGLPDAVRNYLGVTFACALMKTDLLKTLHGLDAERLPIAFNDVDFCLRAVEAGYRNVYTPHAVLVHHESVTKTVIAHPREIGFLRNRWGRFIDHDPYYNPNLTRSGEDASLKLD
jgi:GT2 family glycosyltransferase